MAQFFESDRIKKEMRDIYEMQKELYDVILKFPYMSQDAKWEHIETLKELLEKQQIMWTRLSLSDDPEALEMKQKLVDQIEILGFGSTDMTTIFTNMKDTLDKMQSQLKQ
mgnify:FL=1|tara:strand:+ start:363 stop:692 length:330 start_codon:yes stop_codon:yes gene_type:complete